MGFGVGGSFSIGEDPLFDLLARGRHQAMAEHDVIANEPFEQENCRMTFEAPPESFSKQTNETKTHPP